jgi:retron-type reverse transcriptase
MKDPQRELEHLRKLATNEPAKRFDKLLKIVRQQVFLEMVWDKIQTNRGSQTPGVDGQTKGEVDDQLIERLAQELETGQYQPQPVRRVYIPKGKNQWRGLGIPTIRDRIVQGAVAKVLEAIYEPVFRNCSYGFRPQRSTIHALRHVAWAYRAGATWVIEGDLEKCFDSLSHGIILNCLRQRIKDERFIDLVRQMLQAGVMIKFRYERTYCGAPQGGLCSPILMNVVLHEFDKWLEDHWQVNPPPETPQQRRQRSNPEYNRLKSSIGRWRAQLAGQIPMGRQSPEGLKSKLKEALAIRQKTRSHWPRKAIYYCRYADDYTVILAGYSKEEARRLKAAMANWLLENLGLIQHPQKTRITHWTETFRFLGYNLQGQRNLNGTRWLKLTIPPEAERDLKQRVKQLCRYTQIPETDLFMSVNALLRGWTQYYRYANNARIRFGYLKSVVYWLTAHYLGQKHRASIRKVMRNRYDRDPKTGWRALFTTKPNGKRLFIWHKPPQKQSIFTPRVYAFDARPKMMTAWAGGRSYQQRLALRARYGHRCQGCGKTGDNLVVHHPNRLAKRQQRKLGPANVIRSAQQQQVKLLCPDCHLQHHSGGWRDVVAA